MANKKIIVDGIDVGGCQFFEKEDNYCNIMSCDCHNNCYYKQLKRAEQKLKRIAKVCDKFIPDHFKIITIIEE